MSSSGIFEKSSKLEEPHQLSPQIAARQQDVPLLKVSNLFYAYPQFTIDNLNFQVKPGEFTTIIGSNGSGKSTLLKLISGYLSPLRGRVELQGHWLHALSLKERARLIALVLQESPLNFPLTVREYVLQGRHPHLSWFKFETLSDIEKVQWAMTATDCLQFAQRKLQELSGGERQRVILARALAQEPRLMLLDEPTLNLDLGYQMELVSLLKSLSVEENFTVLMVTHEVNIAAEFSDQVLLLHRGKSVGCDKPESVLTEKLLMEVFGLDLLVDRNPISGAPRVTPVNSNRARL
jgi:iron complex transport system ATP-binding protein